MPVSNLILPGTAPSYVHFPTYTNAAAKDTSESESTYPGANAAVALPNGDFW